MHDHDCSCGNHAHETDCNHADNEEKHENNNDGNTDDKNKDASDTKEEFQDVPLPDPTLLSLVSGLASQAMLSMGIFPNPITGQTTMMLHQAKHLIDTIALLFEKTVGNQTEEEKTKIDSVLHELRMIFIAAQEEKQRRDSQN